MKLIFDISNMTFAQRCPLLILDKSTRIILAEQWERCLTYCMKASCRGLALHHS
jgi:hypothetical protein